MCAVVEGNGNRWRGGLCDKQDVGEKVVLYTGLEKEEVNSLMSSLNITLLWELTK